MGRTTEAALIIKIGDNHARSGLTFRRNETTLHDEVDGTNAVVA